MAAKGAPLPLIGTIQAIFAAGRLRVDRSAAMTPELQSMLEAWSQFTSGTHPKILYTALVVWGRVDGLVSMEIGGQMPPFITDPGEIYRREILTMTREFIGG